MKPSGTGNCQTSSSHRSKFVHITFGCFGSLSSFSSDFPNLNLNRDSGRCLAASTGGCASCYGKAKYLFRGEQNASEPCSIFSAASLLRNLWKAPASCGGTGFATTGIAGSGFAKEAARKQKCRTSCSKQYPPSFSWIHHTVRKLRFTGWAICTIPTLNHSFSVTSKPILR